MSTFTLTNEEIHVRWLEEFKNLVLSSTTQNFAIGDKLLELSEYWENYQERLAEAAKVAGKTVKAIREYRTTAERIPTDALRQAKLNWSQFVEIGRLKKRDKDGKVCVASSRYAIEQVIANTTADTPVRELRKTVRSLTDPYFPRGRNATNPNRIPTPRDKTVRVTVGLSWVDSLLNSNRIPDVEGLQEFVQGIVDQYFVGEDMRSNPQFEEPEVVASDF